MRQFFDHYFKFDHFFKKVHIFEILTVLVTKKLNFFFEIFEIHIFEIFEKIHIFEIFEKIHFSGPQKVHCSLFIVHCNFGRQNGLKTFAANGLTKICIGQAFYDFLRLNGIINME